MLGVRVALAVKERVEQRDRDAQEPAHSSGAASGTVPLPRRAFLRSSLDWPRACRAEAASKVASLFDSTPNPSAAALALASIEVDLAPIQAGQQVIVKWRGHPLFVRRRTPAEIASAQAVDVNSLPDPLANNDNLADSAPATDANRATKPEWLILIGVCTHLGCTPTGFEGDYGGWLCHCHGSQYDTSGRIRKGPAPQNLAVPPYAFLSDTRIKVG